MNIIQPENEVQPNTEDLLNPSTNEENSEAPGEENRFEQSMAEILEEYEECPSCFEGPDRWIYECSECGFVGCYDEVYENGCYSGFPDERQCPECGGNNRMRVGLVGAGTAEE